MPHFRPFCTLIALLGTLGGAAMAAKAPLQAEGSLQGARKPSGLARIELTKGRQVQADVPLKLMLAPGGWAQSGILGDPQGSIRAQQWKGHIRAVVRSPKYGTFIVQEAPDGTSKITELDPASLGGCETDTVTPPSPSVGIDGDDSGGGGDAPASELSFPPKYSQHTSQILTEGGYSEAEISTLASEGVIPDTED